MKSVVSTTHWSESSLTGVSTFRVRCFAGLCVVSRTHMWEYGSYQRLHGRRFSFLTTGVAGTSLGHVKLCKERWLSPGRFKYKPACTYKSMLVFDMQARLRIFPLDEKKPALGGLFSIWIKRLEDQSCGGVGSGFLLD